MKFNSKQVLLVSIALLAVAVLFVMGYKTPSGNSRPAGSPAPELGFDAEEFIGRQKKQLSPDRLKQVEELEAGEKDKENLVKLAGLWDSLNVSYAAAYYTYRLAEEDPSEIAWYMAGSRFYNVANFSNDSLMMVDAVRRARTAFEKVLELNPGNLEAKNALAICIIQDENDVMKGVGMLREVVASDSNNVQAIFTLGMLSMQSAQFEKAVERFEKLTRIQPFNAQYYIYLGEAYARSGEVKKAVKAYETGKTLLKEKEDKKQVDDIINKLIKQ